MPSGVGTNCSRRGPVADTRAAEISPIHRRRGAKQAEVTGVRRVRVPNQPTPPPFSVAARKPCCTGLAMLDIKPADDLPVRLHFPRRNHAPPRSRRRPRARCAREFKVWEGGGEYNVARGLRNCFGLRTAVVHRVRRQRRRPPDRGFHHAGRRGRGIIKWVPYDGIGRTVRNGLNFTERGFGIRGAVGVPDRGNTAASQLKPGDFDWDHIFGKLGVALVPHRRHLRRAQRHHAGTRHRSGQGREQTRHDRQLRSQLPPQPLEDHRRQSPRPGSEPPDRAIRRCHDRQRGGLHRLPRLRSRRRGRTPQPHRNRQLSSA